MVYVADAHRAPEYRLRLETLTPEERDVLEGTIMGRHAVQIAEALAVSPSTIRNRRERVRRKLQADSLADLVRMAVLGSILDLG